MYIYIYTHTYQESSLEKVDILRAEVLFIRDVGARVRRQSEEDLRTGVRQGNHIALSVALQVCGRSDHRTVISNHIYIYIELC